MIAIVMAASIQISGFATVECTAQPDGRIVDCRVINESQAGLGDAAIAAVTSQRPAATPAAKARRTTPGRFRRTVHFRGPDLAQHD